MTVTRVVVISDAFRLDDGGLGRLAAAGFAVVPRYDLTHRGTPEALEDAMDGCWAVVAGSEQYPADLLRRAASLRVIARPGVGVDAVDVVAARELGIAVLTTPGANDESVADHTLALMLAQRRRIVEHDAATRAGRWRSAPPGRDLAGATVGIVGLGAIGRAVARRLAGFGCTILAVEPDPDPAFCESFGIEVGTLDDVAPRLDILTVHLPANQATAGIISRRVLGLLPDGATVVNTSRGSVMDEVALADLIREGHLGGAALDVFADEPVRSDNPIAGLADIVMSPHVAAFSREAIQRMCDATIANLVMIRSGGTPLGIVNPGVDIADIAAAAGPRP